MNSLVRKKHVSTVQQVAQPPMLFRHRDKDGEEVKSSYLAITILSGNRTIPG